MAKSKRHLSRRSKVKNKEQVIFSEPRKLFVGKYLSPKGIKMIATGTLTKKEAWEKYGKNRYKNNPNAFPIKVINHINKH